MKLCPWAEYREGSGATKMHTLLSLCGYIPAFVWMAEGKVNDINVPDVLPIILPLFVLECNNDCSNSCRNVRDI